MYFIDQSYWKKFSYELNSDLYCVASLFDTKNLCSWIKRHLSCKYIQKALKSLVDVVVQFLPKENSIDTEHNSDNDGNMHGVDL